MKEHDYLCRDCGFNGQDRLFGAQVQCPECHGRRIVLTSAWEAYRPDEIEQLRAKARNKESSL